MLLVLYQHLLQFGVEFVVTIILKNVSKATFDVMHLTHAQICVLFAFSQGLRIEKRLLCFVEDK